MNAPALLIKKLFCASETTVRNEQSFSRLEIRKFANADEARGRTLALVLNYWRLPRLSMVCWVYAKAKRQ
jgi:hypothetical protein